MGRRPSPSATPFSSGWTAARAVARVRRTFILKIVNQIRSHHMAGRDSWTSPVNALLDGVESTEGADTDAPETDYGSPWARALREIMERHTGVRADDLRYGA